MERELLANRNCRYHLFVPGGFTSPRELEARVELVRAMIPAGSVIVDRWIHPEAKGVGVIDIKYPGNPRDLVPYLGKFAENLSSSPVY